MEVFVFSAQRKRCEPFVVFAPLCFFRICMVMTDFGISKSGEFGLMDTYDCIYWIVSTIFHSVNVTCTLPTSPETKKISLKQTV